MIDDDLQRAFFRWLKRRSGQIVKAEDFRTSKACDDFDGDWRGVMSALVSEARKAGIIHSAGVTRDMYGSYKTRWLVL